MGREPNDQAHTVSTSFPHLAQKAQIWMAWSAKRIPTTLKGGLLFLGVIVAVTQAALHIFAIWGFALWGVSDAAVSFVVIAVIIFPVATYMGAILKSLRASIVEFEKSKKVLTALQDISNEAIISFDQNLRVTTFGKGGEAIFGWREEEILGKSVGVLMPQRVHKVHDEHVQRFVASAKTSVAMSKRREVFGVRKTGEEFPAEVSIAKVKEDGGWAFVAILRDISQQQTFTTELTSAKVAAESANEAKSRFIANMSHELRTPLNAIIGFSSMMSEEVLGPIGIRKYCEYSADIHKSGRHLLALINTILEMTRMDAGKAELREEVCSVRDIATECFMMIRGRRRKGALHCAPLFPSLKSMLWPTRVC